MKSHIFRQYAIVGLGRQEYLGTWHILNHNIHFYLHPSSVRYHNIHRIYNVHLHSNTHQFFYRIPDKLDTQHMSIVLLFFVSFSRNVLFMFLNVLFMF